MRGGISYIAKIFSKANNKYMKSYDDSKPSKYIMYLDANSSYRWAMSQYSPNAGFKQLNENLISQNSFEEYILEVDLEYPDE